MGNLSASKERHKCLRRVPQVPHFGLLGASVPQIHKKVYSGEVGGYMSNVTPAGASSLLLVQQLQQYYHFTIVHVIIGTDSVQG